MDEIFFEAVECDEEDDSGEREGDGGFDFDEGFVIEEEGESAEDGDESGSEECFFWDGPFFDEGESDSSEGGDDEHGGCGDEVVEPVGEEEGGKGYDVEGLLQG